MSFKNVDIESAMRRLADMRIEEAMRDGKFNNLQGAGQPLDLEPMPATEDARLAWWALRIFKQNDFTPEEVRWRKQIDAYRDEMATATTERRVTALVAAHNNLVRQINTLGTNALKTAVGPLVLEAEMAKLRARLGIKSAAVPVVDKKQACENAKCRCTNPGSARFCRRCGGVIAA